MELYKYTGSVAALTVRFGKAETITLYDSYDDSVAPVRLDVRGALAEYIKEIESTDSEERYMNLDWYYDFNMLLRRIEGSGRPVRKGAEDRRPCQSSDADPQQPRRARLLRLPRFHQHDQAGLDGAR